MKLIKSIEEWRENVDVLNGRIVSWAYNINSGQPGEVKLTALITLGVFIIVGGLFWWIGIQNIARVLWIIAGLQLFSLLYGVIKRGYKKWMIQSFIRRYK